MKKFEYSKLITETSHNGNSRFFIHFEGSREVIARDFMDAINYLGSKGWDCFSVHSIQNTENDIEFEGISHIREAFFKREKKDEKPVELKKVLLT